MFAVLVGMIFPALEKYPAIYDRWELWLTLLWLFGYLAVSTRGSILRKIIAAVVARELTTFVNTAVLFKKKEIPENGSLFFGEQLCKEKFHEFSPNFAGDFWNAARCISWYDSSNIFKREVLNGKT